MVLSGSIQKAKKWLSPFFINNGRFCDRLNFWIGSGIPYLIYLIYIEECFFILFDSVGKHRILANILARYFFPIFHLSLPRIESSIFVSCVTKPCAFLLPNQEHSSHKKILNRSLSIQYIALKIWKVCVGFFPQLIYYYFQPEVKLAKNLQRTIGL